jgi:hypothetical protein
MDVSVTLKINGGKLKNQIATVRPPLEFTWDTPKEVDKDWFDLLLQEAVYNANHVAFPNLRLMDIDLDEGVTKDSDEGFEICVMAIALNALWWTAKEQDIQVEKLASKGIDFKFTEPDFSVDEYVR